MQVLSSDSAQTGSCKGLLGETQLAGGHRVKPQPGVFLVETVLFSFFKDFIYL